MARTTHSIVAVILIIAGLICARSASAEQFDRTVPAVRGARLDVRLFGGELTIRAWDRDAVRVQATHFRSDVIDVATGKGAVTVRARSLRGAPHGIDIEIQVPAWMPVAVSGTYLDIDIAGTRASVNAETVRGDVHVKGGAEAFVLKSVEGEVVVEDGSGRADLSAVNNDIRVTRLKGDVVADTVNGSVALQAVTASSVEVSTVDGDISWNGSMLPAGRYEFATHSGDVDVALGKDANVTLAARAFHGVIRSTLPVTLPATAARGKKTTLVLGSGSSHLSLETFSGTITLR